MNYFLPPEWHPQEAVLLTWPHEESDWATVLPQVEPVFIEIASQILARQRLMIACCDASQQRRVQTLLSTYPGQLDCYVVPSNDTWARDHGPITVLAGKNRWLLDFTFNGWGNKFVADKDNQITTQLVLQGAFEAMSHLPLGFVLEGGSIEVNGQGTLLTTSRCLLANTRNPTLSRAEIEKKLSVWFGVNHFLWLEHGFLAGDDTDSHIDTLARFIDAHTICYVHCDDKTDEHYIELQKMANELKEFRDDKGYPYRLVPLPFPSAKYDEQHRRLPATYANFLFINDAVLVPMYDDPQDSVALAQLKSCFPDREVVGIPCLPLIAQGGSLHCLTMQIPRAVRY